MTGAPGWRGLTPPGSSRRAVFPAPNFAPPSGAGDYPIRVSNPATRSTPMYVPAAFAEPDLTKLHDFIERNSFGLLVSQVEGAPFASHLPFLLDRAAGPHGTLVGHMARANPHWREAGGQT